jgi:hypothetical protein
MNEAEGDWPMASGVLHGTRTSLVTSGDKVQKWRDVKGAGASWLWCVCWLFHGTVQMEGGLVTSATQLMWCRCYPQLENLYIRLLEVRDTQAIPDLSRGTGE